jgi:hypothetical protein
MTRIRKPEPAPFSFRVQESDKALIRQVAAERGLAPSELIRDALRQAGVPLAMGGSRTRP